MREGKIIAQSIEQKTTVIPLPQTLTNILTTYFSLRHRAPEKKQRIVSVHKQGAVYCVIMVLESCITRQERDTMQFPPILKYFVPPFSSTAFSSVFSYIFLS